MYIYIYYPTFLNYLITRVVVQSIAAVRKSIKFNSNDAEGELERLEAAIEETVNLIETRFCERLSIFLLHFGNFVIDCYRPSVVSFLATIRAYLWLTFNSSFFSELLDITQSQNSECQVQHKTRS